MSDQELLCTSEEPDDASRTGEGLDERQEMRRELRRRGVSNHTIERASIGRFDNTPDPDNEMVTVTRGDGSTTELPAYLANYMRKNGDL